VSVDIEMTYLDHEGGKGGSGRGGARGARAFDHGVLRWVVLALIAERPRHGYEIIKAIEDQAGGAYSPSPGVIYPTLTLLQEMGHLHCDERDGRKHYTITPSGEAELATQRGVVDSALARLGAGAGQGGRGRSPQIVRAMENLKLALRLRFQRRTVTEQEIRRIAAAIDAAATEIESGGEAAS
jgi:DNA-binding PadR family transcriptional regulator